MTTTTNTNINAVNFELSKTARDRRLGRDIREGRRNVHVQGRCGYMGSLCPACHADELTELKEWAAMQPAPINGESESAYWSRIGGRFLDAWYDAARSRIDGITN